MPSNYVPLLYKRRDGNILTRRTTDEQLKHVENLLELLNDRLNDLSLHLAPKSRRRNTSF